MADVERETEATHLIPKRGSRRSRDEPGRYGLSGSVHEDPELPESSRAPNLERKWSIEPVQPITLSWTGIQVHVHPQTGCLDRVRRRPPAEPKHILKNVSGCVKPGSLLAILGASGAGKSTLLNVLNQRNVEDLDIQGNIFVNGCKINRNSFTSMSAYVQQDDIFIGLLKVKEQLWFQAMLCMDKHVADDVRVRRVDEVILELGLTKCADTMIGTPGLKKSISGGERKRLAFASEVLTNPPLLFCDEPTSGLDSFMAENVVQKLKDMAARGKTVICTIHQPSSEVYALFDHVLLMADGRVAFMGPAKEACGFFDRVGYPCPDNYNPADHFIHTLAIAPGKEKECRQRVQLICDDYERSPRFDDMMSEIDSLSSSSSMDIQFENSSSPYKTSWSKQFSTVLWRSWITTIREPLATRVKIAQSVFTGLLFGLIFMNQEYDQKGVMNINGVLFLLETQVSFGNIFSVITTFPLEFPVFLREHQNGMYSVAVYYFTKLIAEFPLYLLVPMLFTCISYWMIGLNTDLEAFLICCGVLILVTNVATSYGYVVGCSTSSVSLATAILPTIIIPLMLFGGFFLNAGSVPVYFIWLQYLSWFNYCNEILIVNQWKDVTNITCEFAPPGHNTSQQLLADASSRCFKNGKQVIENFSFHEDNVMTDVYAMVALMVGFRILSFIIMLIRSYRKH